MSNHALTIVQCSPLHNNIANSVYISGCDNYDHAVCTLQNLYVKTKKSVYKAFISTTTTTITSTITTTTRLNEVRMKTLLYIGSTKSFLCQFLVHRLPRHSGSNTI